jgi:succinyl-CoA synthetase beta subunit
MGKLLEYTNAYTMLHRHSIRALDAKYVGSPDDAVGFASGKPIVLKVISGKALHKSKNGLVKLDLSTERDVRSAYAELEKKARSLKPYKILAQKMVTGGLEVIVGGNTDLQFGKMILLGLGGIYVETFKDFALRVCPITRYDADSMIDQLRSRAIVAPDPKTKKMISDLLLNVSGLLIKEKAISELDLNPIILHGGTYDAVDLRVIEE